MAMVMDGFFKKQVVRGKKEKKVVPEKKERVRRKVSNDNGKIPCEICGLCFDKRLHNPKIEPYGYNGKKGLIIGEALGEEEDLEGIPFTGRSGTLLRERMSAFGIDIEEDCIVINACDCRPLDRTGNNRKPSDREVASCWHRKEQVLEKYDFEWVLLLGDTAFKSWYRNDPDRSFASSLPVSALRGKRIYDQKLDLFVYHSYHPSYILRGNEDKLEIFDQDIFMACDHANGGVVPKQKRITIDDLRDKFILVDTEGEADELFSRIKTNPHICFDYETSSYRYYEKIHEIYMVSIAIVGSENVYILPFHEKYCDSDLSERNEKRWQAILENPDVTKIAHNIKHEHTAAREVWGVTTRGWCFDTMISSHILDGTSPMITGLKMQTFLNFGVPNYGESVGKLLEAPNREKNRFLDIPIDDAITYCAADSYFTRKLYLSHSKKINYKGFGKAYELFHNGVIAFSEIEKNGIKIDVDLALRMKSEYSNQIESLHESFFKTKEALRFEKVKGRPIKYNKKASLDDLRELFFSILGLPSIQKTATTDSMDELTLKHYSEKLEIADIELKLRKLYKLRDTYLSQFLRCQIDGFIYPSFNLHIPASYRSSSSDPNFQNIPKRGEEAKEIRKLIISRFGNAGELLEVDYGSMEVRIIACVTKDPALLDYILGGGDMHGDWAEILFLCKKEELSKADFKKWRYIAKNHWVFPLFYGSYYKSVAENTEPPGWFMPTITKKIRLVKWENHLKDCESRFWRQFSGVREWQNQQTTAYLQNGYVRDFSWGFERGGYLNRNKVYNFFIQGPAYHCLQWTINELVFYHREQLLDRVRSLLCGQIHDALFWDAIKKEFNIVKKHVDFLMTEKIREEHPWIIVPLITEWTRGKNWLEMEKGEEE